jgi:hypothetical protein
MGGLLCGTLPVRNSMINAGVNTLAPISRQLARNGGLNAVSVAYSFSQNRFDDQRNG